MPENFSSSFFLASLFLSEAGKEKKMEDVKEWFSFDQANKESDDVNNVIECEQGWWRKQCGR